MIALTNARIFTQNSILNDHVLIIEDGLIKEISKNARIPSFAKTIDLGGANLCAGFIDLQLNGCGGVMFNETPDKETILAMHETNLKSGTTSFLPTFITAPEKSYKDALKAMGDYKKLSEFKNSALGLHLEGPFISVEKKGVHNPSYIRSMQEDDLITLKNHADLITKLTIAPENVSLEQMQQLIKSGIIIAIGHSNANFETAMSYFTHGASFVTHLYNAMSQINSGRDLGVVGASLTSDAFVGIITDGLHVHFANIDLAYKIKQNKLCIVTDALASAGAPENFKQFSFVGKNIYVKDGKCVDENGITAGASITMLESIKNVVQNTKISLLEAINLSTINPACAIKMDKKIGSIQVGKVANLCVFDKNYNIIGVSFNGTWKS
ncbi:MAG: N-acetylglucosamine-6-phosphate deacetylase [Helicobacter sp.]|nr:N-acetylglucosamine-6-phosphate deacetylase [Helicobacter sp.]